MEITAQNTTQHTPLISQLYSAVDAMDAKGVASFVAENVTFKLGNFDALNGRTDVEIANASFFETIKAMRHTISGIWESGSTAFATVWFTTLEKTSANMKFLSPRGLRCKMEK